MQISFWCILLLVFVNFSSNCASIVSQQLRLPATKRFLFFRSNTINERACNCSTPFSCSCCETVTLIYSKTRKKLCSNFMYQRNGMNVDISLNSDTLTTTTVTDYRPFKMCAAIPGSLFSSICVNVLELNQFPRSITLCVRHEILSKSQEWQINYTCASISTILPSMTTVANTTAAASTTKITSSSAMSGATTKPLSTMASTTTPKPLTTGQTMATTMKPNGTSGAVPTSQMGEMGAKLNSQMMPEAQRRRKRRHTRDNIKRRLLLLKHQSRIVNDIKFGPSSTPLALGSSSNDPIVLKNIRKPSPSIFNVPATDNVVVSSDVADIVQLSDTIVDSNNGRPLDVFQPIPPVIDNRSEQYFPSRIPPVVAMTLKEESIIIKPNRGDILFADDNNHKSERGSLIFPD